MTVGVLVRDRGGDIGDMVKISDRGVLMPELDRISVQGFKSIGSLEELKLRPINVLIGPNGSGKSNFIGVFSFLNAIRDGRLQDYVIKAGGASRVLHFGPKVTTTLRIHVSFQDQR